MANIILSKRWTIQPQYAAPIDWGNQLTNGLVAIIDPITGRNVIGNGFSTITGTKLAYANQSATVRGYGSTLGVGTTDSLLTNFNTHNTQRTYLISLYRNGTGGGTLGRVFEKRTAADTVAAEFIAVYTGGSGGLQFSRAWSGAAAAWYCPESNAPVTWFDFAVSYDAGSTSNSPVFYVDGNVKTTTSITAPSGTVVSNGANWVVGNRQNDNARVWDGYIGYVLVFNRILSQAEVKSLHDNPYQIYQPINRRIWLPAGAAAPGSTGTLATTNANDTSAAAGTTTVLGTLAKTNANDTSAASGTTTVLGTIATTNANDTSSASGTTTVLGTLATTNAADTSAASGSIGSSGSTGTLATTNANDTVAASGTTTVTGTLARTNANDSVVASGWAGLISGTVSYTNNNDISAAIGISVTGIVETYSGGIFNARRKTPKQLKEERIKLGILPQEVTRIVHKVVSKAISKAQDATTHDAATYLSLDKNKSVIERQFRNELSRQHQEWQQAYNQVLEIALQEAAQDAEDDEILMMLM